MTAPVGETGTTTREDALVMTTHLIASFASGAWRALISVLPTRRLVVLVVALAPLWLVSEVVAIIALALVAVAVVADVLLLPAKWQLAAQRIVPSNVGLGD
ncbi:MAG: hypothetical protein ABIQ10_04765, partial [Gemmatimonadaceae bacterium]